MQASQSQIEALQRVGLAVLETINDAGDIGAPDGHIYAALMTQGATLSQHQSFMGTLTSRGLLTKSGDCFYITDNGKNILAQLRRKFAH